MSYLSRILRKVALSFVILTVADGRSLRGQDHTLMGMHNQTNETDFDYRPRRRLNETQYRARRFLNETNDNSQTGHHSNETDHHPGEPPLNITENDEFARRLEELTDEEIALLEGPNPCDRVLPEIGDNLSARKFCRDYESLPYILPDCSKESEIVPKIFHSVGEDDSQLAHQQITAAANPNFLRNHLGDADAFEYIKAWCGSEVSSAYSCMAAPAFRADIFNLPMHMYTCVRN